MILVIDTSGSQAVLATLDGARWSESRLPARDPALVAAMRQLAHRRSLVAAGHRFKPDDQLRPFAEAAEILLRTAREVPYRNLEIEYMQYFSVPR
jgi:hypothetical protein